MTESNKKVWQLTAISEALGDLVLIVEDTLTIGRGKDNDVVIGSKQVSRKHAELSIFNGQLFVKDLGSSNGTAVNDVKIEPNKSKHLKLEDVITFALFSFKVGEPSQDVISESPSLESPADEQEKANIDDVVEDDVVSTAQSPIISKPDSEVATSSDVDADVSVESVTAVESYTEVENIQSTAQTIEPVTDFKEANFEESDSNKVSSENVSSKKVASDEIEKSHPTPNETHPTIPMSSDKHESSTKTQTIAPALDTKVVYADTEKPTVSEIKEAEEIDSIADTETSYAVEESANEIDPTAIDSTIDLNTDLPTQVRFHSLAEEKSTDEHNVQDVEEENALAQQADTQVLQAKQAATGQLSGTQNVHDTHPDTEQDDLKTSTSSQPTAPPVQEQTHSTITTTESTDAKKESAKKFGIDTLLWVILALIIIGITVGSLVMW